MLKKLLVKSQNLKNSLSNKLFKLLLVPSVAIHSFLAPAWAQDSGSPFNTDKIIGDEGGDTFVSQIKWIIFTILQIALILAMCALVVFTVWHVLGSLKSSAKSGEWNDFFMSVLMVVIAIIVAVLLSTLGWQWLDYLKGE